MKKTRLSTLGAAEEIQKEGWKPTGKRGFFIKDEVILSKNELYRGLLRFLKASTGKKWC